MVSIVTHVRAAVHVDEARVPLVGIQVTGSEVERVCLKKTGKGKMQGSSAVITITLRRNGPDAVLREWED